MIEDPIQILEVRAGEPARSVMVTVALSAEASQAISVALSEQLDRRRQEPAEGVEEVLALREQAALVERFTPLALADAHSVAQFSDAEVRACLLEVTAYADRVDGEHFQAQELRDRLAIIGQLTATLWEANAAAAAARAQLEAPTL